MVVSKSPKTIKLNIYFTKRKKNGCVNPTENIKNILYALLSAQLPLTILSENRAHGVVWTTCQLVFCSVNTTQHIALMSKISCVVIAEITASLLSLANLLFYVPRECGANIRI